MRRNMQSLGGERVTMTTPNGVKLDSMYLDAQKFRTKLSEAGCKLTTLQLKSEGAVPRQLQAISLSKSDYEKNGSKVLDALKELNALTGKPNDPDAHAGAGWTLVKNGEEHLLVRSEELPKDTDLEPTSHFKVDKNDEWNLIPEKVISAKSQPIDSSSKGSSTVVISSGNAGVYEMHKSEAMFYLFKNVNVVLFNFRGYGHSEGEPTEKGMKLDMESAYQLAKAKSGHEDSQITFKALCMSGGPAAYVAAQHPQTNIILDQSYSDFKALIAEKARDKAESFTDSLMSKVVKSKDSSIMNKLKDAVGNLTYNLVEFAAPDYNSAKNLAKNDGHKVIFFTHDDDLISTQHMEENVRSIAKAGKMDYFDADFRTWRTR